MSRVAIFGLALGVALVSASASANEYYYGGYAPYPPPGYGSSPYVVQVPGPSNYGQQRLPPPPVLNLSEGPRYYRYSGYGAAATPCYDQYVRIRDTHGGWAWGLKSNCDR